MTAWGTMNVNDPSWWLWVPITAVKHSWLTAFRAMTAPRCGSNIGQLWWSALLDLIVFFFLVFGDQGIDTRGFKNTSPWTRQTQLCVWQRFDTVGLDLNAEWTRVSIVFCSIPIEMLSRSSFWPLEYFLIAFSRSVFVEKLCELRAWFNLFLARWRQNCRNPTFPVYRSFS